MVSYLSSQTLLQNKELFIQIVVTQLAGAQKRERLSQKGTPEIDGGVERTAQSVRSDFDRLTSTGRGHCVIRLNLSPFLEPPR